MPIRAFLNDPKNTVVRERLLLHRLQFDLKFAAAQHDYDLVIYESEVDKDGYDLILDDGDSRVSIQLKSKLKSNSTATWSLHRRMLLPDARLVGALPVAPMDCGIGGGAIVIVFDEAAPLAPVTYLYTDFAILKAFERGVLAERSAKARGLGAKKSRHTTSTAKLFELWTSGATGRISIPRGLFVTAKGPSELLALCGLSSPALQFHGTAAAVDLETYSFDAFTGVQTSGPGVGLARAVGQALSDLVDEPRLQPYV